MKKLLLILLPIVYCSTLNASFQLGDLMYRPAMGTFTGQTTFDFSSRQYEDNKNNTPNVDEKNKISTATIKQTASYGFTDDLSFGLEVGYLITRTQKLEIQSKELKSNGFFDPTFIARYHLFNKEQAYVNLDFVLTITPALIEAEEPSATDDSSATSGAMQITLDTIAGDQIGSYGWRANFKIAFNGEATTVDASSGIDLFNYKSFLDLQLGLAGQMRFLNSFSAEIIGEFLLYGKRTQDQIFQASTTTYDAHSAFAFSGKVNYEILPDKLSSSIFMLYKAYSEHDVTGSTPVITKQQKDSEFMFGVLLNFKLDLG
ncbi:MAG: hypothetical protein ISR65_20035 [Bacteriovoracaceae bacterium]|nr:hypothetical protein [Bacteriovoracaceae bacterium]